MSVIFPPRPKSAIPPTELAYYESLGIYCIQPKYNGSRSIIHISNGEVSIYSRHGRPHRNYQLPMAMAKEILALPGLKKGVDVILDGELLSKTTAKDTKNKIVFFDILQQGHYFFLNPDQKTRLEILATICGNPTTLDPMRGMGYQISENLLMAPTFTSGFKAEFEKDYGDEVEGLVLRKSNSVIDNFGRKEYEINWLIRCRKPHKNYSF